MPAGDSLLDRGVRWVLARWLAIANSLVLLYGGLPWLSPILIAFGYPRLGEMVFRWYTPLCHQVPARSFEVLGHQVAFCHRETAMYTALLVGGVLYGWVRGAIRPISLQDTGLLLLPMVLDGTTHLLDDMLPWVALRGGGDGIGTFNWWMRMVTGVLFAAAIVLGVYPRLDRHLSPRPNNE
ncbi:MAG: DUF2085 domain-containing protein [Chloroflexaceae bacterium]|nr:DUF2085 domain-containing protein [Chloroflexaceae bacterium]